MGLVQKLRHFASYDKYVVRDNTFEEAADEIERLQDECERLAAKYEDCRDRACFGVSNDE